MKRQISRSRKERAKKGLVGLLTVSMCLSTLQGISFADSRTEVGGVEVNGRKITLSLSGTALRAAAEAALADATLYDDQYIGVSKDERTQAAYEALTDGSNPLYELTLFSDGEIAALEEAGVEVKALIQMDQEQAEANGNLEIATDSDITKQDKEDTQVVFSDPDKENEKELVLYRPGSLFGNFYDQFSNKLMHNAAETEITPADPTTYELNGEEKVTFLFINHADESRVFNIDLNGKTLEKGIKVLKPESTIKGVMGTLDVTGIPETKVEESIEAASTEAETTIADAQESIDPAVEATDATAESNEDSDTAAENAGTSDDANADAAETTAPQAGETAEPQETLPQEGHQEAVTESAGESTSLTEAVQETLQQVMETIADATETIGSSIQETVEAVEETLGVIKSDASENSIASASDIEAPETETEADEAEAEENTEASKAETTAEAETVKTDMEIELEKERKSLLRDTHAADLVDDSVASAKVLQYTLDDLSKSYWSAEIEGRYEVSVFAEDSAFAEPVQLELKELEKPAEAEDGTLETSKDTLTEQQVNALKAEGAYENSQSLDISFVNADGVEVEPASPVKVRIKVYKEALPEDADVSTMQIKHLKEKSASVQIDTVAEYKGETKQKLGTIKAVDADGAEVSLEEVEDTESETDGTEGVPRKVLSDDAEAVESTFDVNSFSTFTVTWNLEKEFITADGETYKITVTYDKDAGIPDGSTLEVRELERGSEEYMYYYNESLRQVGLSPEKDPATGKDTIGNWAEIIPGLMDDARFFDITILHDGQKVEPTKTVDISIQYVNPLNVKEDQVVKAIHFGEDKTELSDAAASIDHTSFSFQQDSFSVTGTGTVDKVIDTTLPVGDDVVVTYSEVSSPDTTQDEGPVTTKTVTDNGDGTHKITLDILGKTTTTTTVTKANVIVVLDTSGSMDNDGGVSYQEDSSYKGNYGIVNGQYIQLVQDWYGNWYYYEDYYQHRYYGQRYRKTTQSRIEGAKDAVKAIANTLLSKNTSSNPDLVQMALITFATNAETKQMPTTSASIFNDTVDKLKAEGGTNWEAALQMVGSVKFGENDKDPTYVIFVSDGNPTYRNTRGSTEYLPVKDNDQWYRTDYLGNTHATNAYFKYREDNISFNSEKVYGLGSDDSSYVNYSPTSMQRCYDNALDEAQALVKNHYQFYTIGAYGKVSWMQNFTTDAGAPKNHYYSANDSAALSEALESIADAITNTLGYSNVQTTDGITALSSVSANIDGGIIEGCEYSKGGVPWSDAPGLTLSQDGNSVTWDLSTVGALENGVHYTASFNIWSSQDAYDLVADLNNELKTYDNLSQEQKDQIIKNEDGTYSLKTNTSLSTTFTQNGSTKTQPWDEGNNTMSLVCSAISLQKKWENKQDQQTETKINLIIKKDGATYLSKTLQSDTNWKADIYLAPGVIKTKTNGYDVMETGHDYSIEENYSDDVYWEFEADIYHPMVIDGKLTLLKKVNANDTHDYQIKDECYVKVDDNSANPTITVKNIRKSSLSLKKEVVDKDNKPVVEQLNDLFTYKITVTDSDPKSAKVKFYVTDDQNPIQDVDVTEAKQDNTNGYYSVDSGKEFQIKLKKGWNLKFVNLSSGSTYSIEEIDIPTGYSFVSWSTGDSNNKVVGTIDKADQSYTVTNTNKLWTTDLNFIKQDTEGNSLEGAVFEISKAQTNAENTTTYVPIDLTGKVDEGKLNKSAILKKVVTGQL